MADLSAVLRKTIDGLPNATPELRAKVYDKARTAILRQIENANPPLSENVADTRRNTLEDAIRVTEAHYADAEMPLAIESNRAPPAVPPQPDAGQAPASRPAWPKASETPFPPADAPRMPRAETGFGVAPPVEADVLRRASPLREQKHGADRFGDRFGPVVATEPDTGFDIPDADTSAPKYAPQRTQRRAPGRKPAAVAAVVAILVAGAGAGAYVYRDQITAMIVGISASRTATGNATRPDAAGIGAADETDVAGSPSTLGTSTGEPSPSTENAPAASTPASLKRRFTQRLQPDGTEVDSGPAVVKPNAFDEGTNIAAATPEPAPAPAATPPPAAAQAPASPPAAPPPGQTASIQPNSPTPAVAQKAMFYEERTSSQQGTQQVGNVVWSIVNEPPAEGQPPEPAIRAIADVPNDNIKMTMTIRRNLDTTLPASHVIELQFDVPPGFEGGQVTNVQKLALKPSEEARGEPLIGVAGKISDGFFIIALNNLDKATETNLALLGRQEWIDIPIAYATGRRALLSIEKGVPGDRIFKQALEAWAAKT